MYGAPLCWAQRWTLWGVLQCGRRNKLGSVCLEGKECRSRKALNQGILAGAGEGRLKEGNCELKGRMLRIEQRCSGWSMIVGYLEGWKGGCFGGTKSKWEMLRDWRGGGGVLKTLSWRILRCLWEEVKLFGERLVKLRSAFFYVQGREEGHTDAFGLLLQGLNAPSTPHTWTSLWSSTVFT